MATKPTETSPNDVTLDAAISGDSHVLSDRFHLVEFIEGSRPKITSEIASLLHVRLRAAAGFLFLGSALFLLWRLARWNSPRSVWSWTFYSHVAMTIIIGLAFALLCRRKPLRLGVLRVYEAVLFGLPVAFILATQYSSMQIWAARGYLPSQSAPWIAIVFTYAMFIPNTWQRAAVILGVVCLLPIALMTYLRAMDPDFTAALRNDIAFPVEITLNMLVSYLMCIYGTYMIGSLRREAWELRQLGQYRLCRQIGSGGMGEVYLAEHQMMKRPCAIKLIRPGKAADPQALARFEREVRATAKLSHWNTIEIFDFGRTEDGTFYYVMEYLPGLSLADLVEKYGPLPPARAIHLLMQTCDALGEAHAAGLIHRDIKPGNIFAAQRGGIHDVAKLLDFGLAKPISTEGIPIQLTQDGSITGSPLFMSPEHAIGDSEPDARSDIYSLGAVAYYILTGTPPFVGDKPIKILMAHAQQEVVPPSRRRADVPADVEKVVLRCLAKDPANRYQTIAALRQALSECIAAGGWTHEDAADWWHTHGTSDEHVDAMAAAAI